MVKCGAILWSIPSLIKVNKSNSALPACAVHSIDIIIIMIDAVIIKFFLYSPTMS